MVGKIGRSTTIQAVWWDIQARASPKLVVSSGVQGEPPPTSDLDWKLKLVGVPLLTLVWFPLAGCQKMELTTMTSKMIAAAPATNDTGKIHVNNELQDREPVKPSNSAKFGS